LRFRAAAPAARQKSVHENSIVLSFAAAIVIAARHVARRCRRRLRLLIASTCRHNAATARYRETSAPPRYRSPAHAAGVRPIRDIRRHTRRCRAMPPAAARRRLRQ